MERFRISSRGLDGNLCCDGRELVVLRARGFCRGRNLLLLRPGCARQWRILHRKDSASITIEGAPADNAAAFHEEINGKNFTVTISHLPAGRYTISIGEVETLASAAAGDRVFDVTAGDVSLTKNFDIVAAAGGVQKVC